MSSWRDTARPIIAKVIEEYNPDVDYKSLKVKLREAYPFGERKYHPYKVWLDEIKRQLTGNKKPIKEQNERLF
jgi:hypothetical protein